jgi:FAD/FMN-containing dehydrogenase
VGAANVFSDAATLAQYSQDMSFVKSIRPACVVKPPSAGAVKKLVQEAGATRTPLVPVSSGSPHFRGDTVPSTGGAVVVDLSNMKKIMNVDRERRVAMVEPGVTFGELIPELTRAGIRLNMPLLPRQTKTVTGSLLEREPVMMPKYQWDVSDPLACLEVFFGSGDVFRTGQSAGPGTVKQQWKAGGVQKAPYGPGIASLHRLVQGAQGSMGIVTWVSMRCELKPALERPFFTGSADLTKLIDMAAWLVRLRMVNECFILNKVNLAAIFASNRSAVFEELKAALPEWALFYVVAGYEYYPEERVSTLETDITEITRRLGLNSAGSLGGLSARQMLKIVQQPCRGTYWKLRRRGGCEDIFFLTINDKVPALIKTLQDSAIQAGYPVPEMGIYIQPVVQGTGIHVEFNLFYDPADKTEAARVKSLCVSATRALMDRGAFFSRPYGEVTGMITNRDAASLQVLKNLKHLFDPNGIMNPGKAGF